MKKIILGVVLAGFASVSMATDKADLDNRINTLRSKFQALQEQPAKAIPPETLAKAQGVVLLDLTKGGLIVGYEGGSGIALVKQGAMGSWSAPLFVKANSGSLGLQAGGERNFAVVLLMDTNSLQYLTDGKFQIGAAARGTAGRSSTESGTTFNRDNQPSVVVFDDRKGLYGGANVKGGAISPDKSSNRTYYGEDYTPDQILFGHQVKATATSKALGHQISEWAQGRTRPSPYRPAE